MNILDSRKNNNEDSFASSEPSVNYKLIANIAVIILLAILAGVAWYMYDYSYAEDVLPVQEKSDELGLVAGESDIILTDGEYAFSGTKTGDSSQVSLDGRFVIREAQGIYGLEVNLVSADANIDEESFIRNFNLARDGEFMPKSVVFGLHPVLNAIQAQLIDPSLGGPPYQKYIEDWKDISPQFAALYTAAEEAGLDLYDFNFTYAIRYQDANRPVFSYRLYGDQLLVEVTKYDLAGNPTVQPEYWSVYLKQAETDEAIIDTDGDGLSDSDERVIWQTDPNNSDSDGDGFSDKEEIDAGYNPLGEGEL